MRRQPSQQGAEIIAHLRQQGREEATLVLEVSHNDLIDERETGWREFDQHAAAVVWIRPPSDQSGSLEVTSPERCNFVSA
jgi:hypothetical protein